MIDLESKQRREFKEIIEKNIKIVEDLKKKEMICDTLFVSCKPLPITSGGNQIMGMSELKQILLSNKKLMVRPTK